MFSVLVFLNNTKACMFFIAFPRHRLKSCAPVRTLKQTVSFAEHSCIVSFTAGIKTPKPTAGKWGREVDCHTQNNGILYFCFRNAIEEQSQAAGKHSTPPEAHLLQPAPLHLHRQMIAKSIRRDIKPPASRPQPVSN